MKTRTLALIFALLDDPAIPYDRKRKLKDAARRISMGFANSSEALHYHDSIASLLKP